MISDELKYELEELNSYFEKPNIFIFMKNLNHEIRHSNFIAWLIDEKENHGQHRLFIDRLLSKFGIKYSRVNSYSVSTEVRIDKAKEDKDGIEKERRGSIDILLESKKHVVVIENKTKTADSKGQLRKYRLYAEKKYANKTISYLFLSPNYNEPKDLQERRYWKSVSYIQVYEALSALSADISCDKTKTYVADYLHALGTNWLKITPIYQDAKSIIKKRRSEILKIVDDDAQITSKLEPALSFLKRNLGKSSGNGFFGEENIYADSFIKVMEEQGYLRNSGGNSTYFPLIPSAWSEIQKYCGDSPIDFCFRYSPDGAKFRFFLALPEVKEEHNKEYVGFRYFLLASRNLFCRSGVLNKGGRGKKNVTFFTGEIEFDAIKYSLSEIDDAVREIFQKDVNRTVVPYTELVLGLFADYKLLS